MSSTRALGGRTTLPSRGALVTANRRGLVTAGVAILLVLGFVTGFIPGLFGGGSAPGPNVAATSRPAPTGKPFSYRELAPSLDGKETTPTRSATVTISGAVPPELAGRSGYKVRIYVARGDAEPVKVKDASIGTTSLFVAKGIKLAQGGNTFTATILGPDGEGRASSPVTWVLDTTKPKVSFSDPANGTVVNRPEVRITGKTQAGSRIEVRNTANKATATEKADDKGVFRVAIAIRKGDNPIVVTATDPAGNVGSAPLTIVGGTGRLTVQLTASPERISRSGLPARLTLTALALDPDGNPFPGAEVVFTLTLVGLPPITDTGRITGPSGRASFETTVPARTVVGKGTATVSISTGPFGDATDQIWINVVR